MGWVSWPSHSAAAVHGPFRTKIPLCYMFTSLRSNGTLDSTTAHATATRHHPGLRLSLSVRDAVPLLSNLPIGLSASGVHTQYVHGVYLSQDTSYMSEYTSVQLRHDNRHISEWYGSRYQTARPRAEREENTPLASENTNEPVAHRPPHTSCRDLIDGICSELRLYTSKTTIDFDFFDGRCVNFDRERAARATCAVPRLSLFSRHPAQWRQTSDGHPII